MSDMSTPAGSAGGATTTPSDQALAELLAQVPAKVRVHALAKLLEVSSKDVIAALEGLGEAVRGAQSSVSKDTAARVARALLAPEQAADEPREPEPEPEPVVADEPVEPKRRRIPPTPVFASASPLFLPPEPPVARPAPAQPVVAEPEPVEAEVVEPEQPDLDLNDDDDEDGGSGRRRRRGRRGRGRGKGAADEAGEQNEEETPAAEEPQEEPEADEDQSEAGDGGNRRRRRRRRRKGGDDDSADAGDDPPNTVVHVRETREARDPRDTRDARDDNRGEIARDEVRSVRGSTRLEAKRQRRRDGREAGRRRAPILSEAEFLARREAVDRAMVVREHGDRTQIGVLEDGVLVEHFVTSFGTGSLVGNVYLGRVQNVLPSMEAAFVDIGRGRNAVLYAGEVDWDAAGLEGKARKIEQALSTGDSVLVQVTKDPVGHKGARLTTQISLPGRFLVYVPGGGATGISRKLPENERRRLKDLLKRIVPEDAGVIIRTASEGISEEELGRDVRRLQAQWQVIKEKSGGGGKRSSAPVLLYEEPDLLVKVVRDLFTEDFTSLVVQGDTAWETIDAYVRHVAPELLDRVRKHVGVADVFATHRVDEQLLKALDRKVWLPSGGYLVIDRTEAMTVIDVNTGKFTGSGGNLEETVTRNNLESAEEIVRQLRLRDIGGIIVIDFIDMVLESNRDLVLRRLTECLGRDRTRHQVAEVTSLGLVQMTRKRVGTGLLEAFSTTCEHCKGRGVVVTTEPTVRAPANPSGQQQPQPPAPAPVAEKSQGGGRRNRNRGGGGEQSRDEAAKVAVRDIAKATTKHDEHPVEHTSNGSRPHAQVEEPTPVVEPAAPVAPAAPVEEAPTSRRRRRSASRAQGAAAPVTESEPVAAPVASAAPWSPPEPVRAEPEPVVSASAAEVRSASQPRETQPEPQVAEPVAAVVPPRRRVARRAASRPAGPPVDVAQES
ncbi:translation initiation factor IF-2 N-terminal domain-containing protein [Actinokineospora terrae]|uniref:Ribonuclease E n=1 Tax=Actinokineospora terrae TaxID=155974 RepID=A0A1H9R174_9PSEU|nr:translation initiation factor IF-2 N-terminal domain-containing protein [Actinokineospora terrae]SER65799.1 ribonuclease E [Actinokineospora terrae]